MRCASRLTTLAAAISPLVITLSTAHAALIDDFSGTLGAYTATRILKATAAAPDNVYSWEIASGSLQINTTSYGGIEQYALTRTDETLDVGEELRVDYLPNNLSSQDIGLYVGAGTPTAGVRQDYVSVYVRNDTAVYSRGFNGTTELSLAGGAAPAIEGLFVRRTAADVFELGYIAGGAPTVLTTRTMANTSIGSAIGFYADIRGAGIRGNLDNLRIIPEPATGALAGVALAGLGLARRKK